MINISTSGHITVKRQSKSKGNCYFSPYTRSLVLDDNVEKSNQLNISSVNSNPKNLFHQLKTALYDSPSSYNKYIVATVVTSQGTSVFEINDVKDIMLVKKNGKKSQDSKYRPISVNHRVNRAANKMK